MRCRKYSKLQTRSQTEEIEIDIRTQSIWYTEVFFSWHRRPSWPISLGSLHSFLPNFFLFNFFDSLFFFFFLFSLISSYSEILYRNSTRSTTSPFPRSLLANIPQFNLYTGGARFIAPNFLLFSLVISKIPFPVDFINTNQAPQKKK
ncbi:hypothetical protein CLIB1423_05S05182 [[Candida] railenensis]|uniref:Transmembrane protein n=1 Tax=[Candida] railenensis TaxID=45579 RepID=A0A9P0QPF5_9ASCO|nr:hypothetical protein CLIB1423_05S05182 [[Candida] railenensis]